VIPVTKPLWHSAAARRAILTRVSRIHFDHASTSLFSFVAQHRNERSPRSIEYILRKKTSCERFNAHTLNGNNVVITHHSRTGLMKIVCPLPRDCGVATSNCISRDSSAARTFRGTCERALQHAEAPRRPTSCPQTGNEATIGEHRKRSDSDINTNATIARSRCGGKHPGRQRNVPSTSITAEYAAADLVLRWNWSMGMNPERARHALESHAAVLQRNPGKALETEAIEPASPSKPRKPGFLLGPQAPEEAPIGFVQPLKGAPLQAHWKGRSFIVGLAPLGESLALVEEGSRNAGFSKCIDPLFEGGVIELTLCFKDSLKGAMLPLAWKYPKTIGKDHPSIPSIVLLDLAPRKAHRMSYHCRRCSFFESGLAE